MVNLRQGCVCNQSMYVSLVYTAGGVFITSSKSCVINQSIRLILIGPQWTSSTISYAPYDSSFCPHPNLSSSRQSTWVLADLPLPLVPRDGCQNRMWCTHFRVALKQWPANFSLLLLMSLNRKFWYKGLLRRGSVLVTHLPHHTEITTKLHWYHSCLTHTTLLEIAAWAQ